VVSANCTRCRRRLWVRSVEGGFVPRRRWQRDRGALRTSTGALGQRLRLRVTDPGGAVRAAQALVQEIAVAIDVRREVERVLARETLGQLRIASFEGLDDFQVIDDRACGAVALYDRCPADGAHVD